MTTESTSPGSRPPSEIGVNGDVVTITGLEIEDASLARLVAREPEGQRADLIRRVIETGTRGVLSMGIGIDLGEIDRRVRHTVVGSMAEAEAAVQRLFTEARQAIESTFDPDQRQSAMAKTLAEFTAWREGFLDQIDPARAEGHGGRLIERLTELLGPAGPLEQRLADALDPQSGTSALGALAVSIDRRFTELRDLMVEDRGRRQEAERGTRKGFDFEDELETELRRACRPLGAVVERTSHASGLTSTDSMVGDFVIGLPNGRRVVLEAKHAGSITLTGTDGILAELDRAMANRGADVAICVSKVEAFPQEVGPFGVYGNRILVVDDGEGTMLAVALRWATLVASGDSGPQGAIDMVLVADRLDRIRQLAQLFKANRRALTGVTGSIEQVRSSLDSMRTDLLELLEDVDRALRGGTTGTVVPIARQAAG
jgi:hypothetical protein